MGEGKPKSRRWIGALIGALVLLGLLIIAWPRDKYAVGADVTQFPELKSLNWSKSPAMREKVTEYCTRNQVSVAHFTGEIILLHEDERFNQYRIQVLDGKLGPHGRLPEGNPDLTRDFVQFRSTHLRDMLEKTRNDWRITNHNNHFIEPPDLPFTGDIYVSNGHILYTFHRMQTLKVVNNRIKSSRGWWMVWPPFLSPT